MIPDRLTEHDLQHPAHVVSILEGLQMHYLQGVDDGLSSDVRRERVQAWQADAQTAAQITVEPYAATIRSLLASAEGYASTEV